MVLDSKALLQSSEVYSKTYEGIVKNEKMPRRDSRRFGCPKRSSSPATNCEKSFPAALLSQQTSLSFFFQEQEAETGGISPPQSLAQGLERSFRC